MDPYSYQQLLNMLTGQTDQTQPHPNYCTDLACLMGVPGHG